MKKKYVLFDLDGTLTDSQAGIMNSIEYMLAGYGITVENRDSLRPWLGPPLKNSLMEYYQFEEEKALLAVERYREYFDRQGIFENQVYDGIRELLQTLWDRGYQLMTATSKPEEAAMRILDHFDLSRYFVKIGGATLDDSRVDKGDVVRYVLSSAGVTDKSQAVLVGDREHDVLGAKENGIECIGVLYGYGSREELIQAGVTYVAETTEDILRYL